MKTPLPERSETFGEELDVAYLALLKSRAPYEQCQRELLKLEKDWLRRARTEAQRLSVRRAVASTLLTEAYGSKRPWKDFGAALRRLQRLGFSDLGMRVHVACRSVQSAHLYPEELAREAWALWDEAERGSARGTPGNPRACTEGRPEAPAHGCLTARLLTRREHRLVGVPWKTGHHFVDALREGLT